MANLFGAPVPEHIVELLRDVETSAQRAVHSSKGALRTRARNPKRPT